MFLETFAEKVQAVIPSSASSAIDGCIRAVAVLEAAERGWHVYLWDFRK